MARVDEDLRMYANQLKLIFLNWILPQLGLDDCVGSEVRILDSGNIADLVLVIDEKIIGIEIKSARDSFRRLAKQAATYASMFHSSYLLLEQDDVKAIENARGSLPPSFGMLLASPKSISIKREARFKQKLAKEWAVNWLTRRDLENLLRKRPGYPHGADVESLRMQASKSLTAAELNQAAVKIAQKKLRDRYERFTHEIGRVVTSDDLENLHVGHKFISGD